MSGYDLEQAARMLAALRATPTHQQLDTLAVVCRVYIEGYLEQDVSLPGPHTVRRGAVRAYLKLALAHLEIEP
jgi:hypothetical protein